MRGVQDSYLTLTDRASAAHTKYQQ